MVLSDVDGSLIWETNTTSTDARMAELLDTEQAIIVAEMHETGHFVSSGRFQFIASDMVCGRNAICVNTPEPKCPCPPGYEITEPGNWNKGCKPLFNVTLFQSQQVKFVELPHVDHRGFDLNYTESISIDSCMKSCVGDYRSTVETSQLAILNGTDPICQSDELETMIGSPSMYNTNTKRIRWVYLYSFASAIGFIELLFVVSAQFGLLPA
ncbi:hypothetical protein D5086_012561 [Populus alba]|uniref:Uncharacterized protein n=1 Tax=Populus alba TaxID=43335 RepID=A0ACC4C2G8_POPAL